MENIQKIVLVVHTLIAVLIITLVLLQRGKGADAGAAFGAGASGTVFGARGSSSFFSRATAVLATAFFVSSLALAYLSSQVGTGPESLLDDMPAVEAVPDADDTLPELPVDDTAVEDELPTLEDAIEEDEDALPTLEEEPTS